MSDRIAPSPVARDRTAPDFLARLAGGEVLVSDGGLGSLLMERGLPPGAPPESLNLSSPGIVQGVAAEYADAGADLVTTNTFGASPLKLALHGLADHMEEINRTAVAAVKRAVGGRRIYVAASCGPSGRMLRPYGEADPAEVSESYAAQMSVLAGAGADLIIVETMMDVAEAALAVRAARAISPALPVLATMTFDRTPRGFFTIMGVSVGAAAAALAEAGADVVGSNCGNGSEAMVEVAAEFRRHTRLPLLIQPNAGLPRMEGGRAAYDETPEFVAGNAARLLDLGVAIVGGCCGTTPAHIRALRRLVDTRRTGA